ncbi:MAG: hypothetical protein R3E82_19155 [Pseudomonadales bacterium]|nr:hypothetical protein [Pseudomonadales bacterium]
MWRPAETVRALCLVAAVSTTAAGTLSATAALADSGLLSASLGRWIDSEAAPELAQTLASHPRFRGETIKVVSMRDGRTLEAASRLHQAVEQRLTQQLLQYPGVRIVWNESRQPCGTPQPVTYLLGVELERDGSSSHKANISMIDVSESLWVSGVNLNWQGRLTAPERSAFSRAVETQPRGSIDSPMTVTDSHRIAELMEQNLRCALPDGLQGPLYLTPPEPGAIAQISGQLRTRLSRTPFAAVTRTAEEAEWKLSLQSEPASGSTHQLQLLLEDTGRNVTQQVAAVYVVGLDASVHKARQNSDLQAGGLPTVAAPASASPPAMNGFHSDRQMLSVMRFNESEAVGVCRESRDQGERGACVEVSFELLQPAYLFVFSTRDRRLSGLSCEIWRDRSDRGEQRYRVQIPAADNSDRPGVGVYAIASGRRDVATRLDRHLRAAEGMCSGSKPADLTRWLADLEKLIAERPDEVQWQAIQLANSPAGVRRL